MKINKISVTGVFNYTDDALFEENDFVISDGVIYICKPSPGVSEVIGENPSTSKNFVVYLGEQSTTLSEYLNFLDTAEGENKYISTLMLQSVLNSFMLGIDGKGVIGSNITYSDGEFNFSMSGTVFTDPNTVISDIMNHPNINHATLRVSRSLPELIVYVGNLETTETYTDLDSCILKQYTYLSESNGHKIRVQELIDQVGGMIYYRSADIEQDIVNSSTNFRCATVDTKTLKEKADNLFSLYNSKLKILQTLEDSLKSNFRYKRILVDGKQTTLEVPNLGETKPEITVMISVLDGMTQVIRNYETAYSLLYTDSEGLIPKYGIGDYVIKTIISEENSVNLFLENKDGSVPSSNVWISGFYYREYYEK